MGYYEQVEAAAAAVRRLVTFHGQKLMFAVAATAMAGSLYYSEYVHFTPCELCWFQRIAMYPLAILLGVALVTRSRLDARYVVTLADLNDLRVELDISQNDFARLKPGQRGIITVDAWPGAEWQGVLDEIAPEANRQKAAVPVKVKVLNPDARLRPEMNAAVAFLSDEPAAAAPGRPVVYVPPAAVRNDRVYVVVRDRLVERTIRTSGNTPLGLRVEEGLAGGEDVVLNPGPHLRAGMKVKVKRP